jgi:hypothetical protein
MTDPTDLLDCLTKHRGALINKGSYEYVNVKTSDEDDWYRAAEVDELLKSVRAARAGQETGRTRRRTSRGSCRMQRAGRR